MPTIFRCPNCSLEKEANYRLKEQKYCGAKACQRLRQREHHKKKMAEDASYRRDHLQSIADWRTKQPWAEYQRQYRQTHPKYVEQNREQQRRRNQKRRQQHLPSSPPVIVEGDACNPIKSGTYLLTPCARVNASAVIVKGDAFVVELSVFQAESAPRPQAVT
ncbi:MAG: hypothetical protein QN127_11355 [Armatimonadota bacterium]|nr:hypothetical protein [Armatimonadota bacterium]